MRRILVSALALGVVLSAAPAQSRDVLRLKASSRWNLHYAEDSCRLGRSFGEGGQKVTLILSQLAPGESFRMLLAGEVLRPRRSTPPLEATIRFGPQEGELDVTVDTGTLGEQRALIVNGSLRIAPLTEAEIAARDQAWRRYVPYEPAPIGTAREAAANWLELGNALKSDLVLETGPMGKPFAALRTCAWDTVKAWGLDVEQQKRLIRKPWSKRRPEGWFHSDDYPMDMVRGGYQGIVNFRIMVDVTGKATSCHVQDSTRPKDFDEIVCRNAMKRAVFEPALDAHGKPVASFWLGSVQFRIGR